MIKLQLIETLNDGSVNEINLSQTVIIASQSGALYTLTNVDLSALTEPMTIFRLGLDLIVTVHGNIILTIEGFFKNGANATFLTPSQGSVQPALEINSSLNIPDLDLIWQALSSNTPDLKVVTLDADAANTGLLSVAALASLSGSSAEPLGESSGQSSAATTPPVYTSLSVDTSSNVIVITYDSTLDGTNLPDATDFTISQNSGPISVASVAVSGSTVILTLASVINSGERLTVAYTDPTSGNDAAAIQGIAGDDADSISKTLAAGVVADGYIRGATVFIDTDGDGYYTAGVDVVLGTTDANGAFMIPDGVTGTVIASGGVNIDTGLPNTLTLMAPEGSSVINPLTTLVEEYLVANAGAVTASEASAAVSAALGLPTGVDLLFFDPLNTTNSITTDGIDVQKAAAQVATMLTLVADTQATTLNAQTAVTNVTQKLIASIKSVADGTTIAVDLADASQITALVAGVTSGNIASLVSDANTANSSISTASNISNISQAQSSALDDISPILKGLGLTAATDSGASATDSITKFSGATLRVSLDVTSVNGGAAVIGDTLSITQDIPSSNQVVAIDATNIKDGYVDIAVTLSSASTVFTANITDAANNVSTALSHTVTFDTVAPTVALTSDLLTSSSALIISGTAEADATVSVVVGGATYIVIAQSGVWSIDLASAPINSGVLSLDLNGSNSVDITATDAAGNTSSQISSNLVIDATAPAAVSLAGIAFAGSGAADGTLNAGDTVAATITFDSAVDVVVSGGTPTVNLLVGSQTVSAAYTSGTGSQELVFTYVVTSDTDANSIAVVAGSIVLNAGTIQDPAGNNASLNYTLDTRPPVEPATPSLLSSSDTGDSNSDSITYDTTPTVKVVLNTSAGASKSHVAGDTVQVLVSGTVVQTQFLTGADISNGYIDLTLPAQTEGTLAITANVVDILGNTSDTSATALSVSLDTSAPLISITDTTSDAITDGSDVTFTFTFDEVVEGFEESDITISGGSALPASFPDIGAVYTLVITPDDGQSSGSIDVLVNGSSPTSVKNLAGLNMAATNYTHSQAYDTLGPVVSSVTVPPVATYGEGDQLNFVVTFNEALDTSASVPELNITVGTDAHVIAGGVVSGQQITYTYTVVNTDGGTGGTSLSVMSLANSVTDILGNVSQNPVLNGVGDLAAVIVDGAQDGSGVDGYLSGVTIYSDNNQNGELDADDSVAIANATGGFKMYGGNGPIIMYGGTDISTGLDFGVQYEAPAGYSIINPISSLVRAVQRGSTNEDGDNGLTNDQAYEVIRGAIYGTKTGVTASQAPNYDPFSAAANASSTELANTAVEYQRVAAAIATVVEVVSEAMVAIDVRDGLDNSIALNQKTASVLVFDTIISAIKTNAIDDGSLLTNLADTESGGFLDTLLTSVSSHTITVLTPDQTVQAVTIIGTAMTTIANASGLNAIGSLTEITKVQLVAQGEAGANLALYLKGDPSATVFSAEAFSTTVSDAAVGVVVPVSYSISEALSNASVLEGQNGETSNLEFVVTRGGNTSVTSTIEWVVSGGAMLDASHFAFNAIPSGALTFQAGDSEKTIAVALAGNDIKEGNRPFMISLVDASGTANLTNPNAFATIRDDDPYTPVITLDTTSQITANKGSLVNASVDYYDANAELTVVISADNASVSSTTFSGNLASINNQLKILTVTGIEGSVEGIVTIGVAVDGRQASGQSELVIHNAPIALTPQNTLQVTAGKVTLVSDLAVADVNGGNLSVTVTSEFGSLQLADSSGLSLVTVANGIELYGSALNINSALAGLYFTANAINESASITLSADDGDPLTDVVTSKVNLSIQAADPIMILADGTSTLTQGKASALVGISVADTDSSLLSFTLIATEGAVSATSIGSVVVAGSGTSQLTLIGSAADINTSLTSLRFTTTPDATAPTLSASLSDNDALSVADPVNIGIPLVVVSNTPPKSGGNQTIAAINEDAGAISITVTNIQLSDIDGSTPKHIRILAAEGAVINDDILLGNTGSLILVSNGAVSISLTPEANRTEDVSLTYAVVDPLISALNSLPAIIKIPITAINDALVIGMLEETLVYTEGDSDVALASRLTLNDVDSPSVYSAKVTIDNFQTGDVLKVAATHPLISPPSYANGVLTLSGVADVNVYQDMLSAVLFSNTSDDPSTEERKLTISVTDTDQTQGLGVAGETTSMTLSVGVSSTNDAPIVTLTQLSATFDEGGAPLSVVGTDNVVLSDADDSWLSGATLSISSGYLVGEDSLAVATLPDGISALFSNLSGSLTLVGRATLAEYQTALSAITYANSSEAPSTIARTLSLVVVDDKGQSSNAMNVELSVNGTVDAPDLDLNGVANGTDNSVIFVKSLYPAGVAIASNAQLSDVDSATIDSLTVTLTGEPTDHLVLSESAKALLKVNAMSMTSQATETGFEIKISNAAATQVYEGLLQGLLYTSSAGKGDPRSVSISVVDANGTSVSIPRSVTLIQPLEPFAAIASREAAEEAGVEPKTLRLSGSDVSGDVRIDMPAAMIMANASKLAVAGDAIFTAKHIDGSAASGVNLTVIGTSQDNIITAGAGDDVIYGGGGADTINAGAGNDSIMYQASSIIDGGADIDTLMVTSDFNLNAHSKITNIEVLSALNAANGVTLSGTAAAETIIGSDYADTLILGAGDTGLGGKGKDTFDVIANGVLNGDSNTAITITDIGIGDRILLTEGSVVAEPSVSEQGVLRFNDDSQAVTLTGWDASWSLKQLTSEDSEDSEQYTVVKVPTQTVTIEKMSQDSGLRGDWLTASGAENRLVFGSIDSVLNASEVVEVSFNGGKDWNSANTIGTDWSVVDADLHGSSWEIQGRVRNTSYDVYNAAKVASQEVVLDTNIDDLAISLTLDSGLNNGDGMTHTGTYQVTGQETGASVRYSANHGVNWSAQAPVAKLGTNSIQVQQTDAAGNQSGISELVFTLDSSAPTIALKASSLNLSANGSQLDTAQITGTYSEPLNAMLEQSDIRVIGGGLSNFVTSLMGFTATFTPDLADDLSAKKASIQVDSAVQTDGAGNANVASNTLLFSGDTLDNPIVSTLGIDTSKSTLSVTFDRTLDADNLPAMSAFTATLGGSDLTITKMELDEAGLTLTLTVSEALTTGSVTINYKDPTTTDDTDAVQGANGIDLSDLSMSGQAVQSYLVGAQMHLDTDGDFIYTDGTDTRIGTSDAAGVILLPENLSGAMVATGGTQLNTGFASSMVLLAAAPAMVINPLTTLLYFYSNSYHATESPQAAVLSAFGLSSTLKINTYDPLTSVTNATEAAIAVALATQKVAAQLSVLATYAIEAATASALGQTLAIMADLGALINPANNASTPIDLTDKTLVAELLAASGADADAAHEIMTYINTATELSQITTAQVEAFGVLHQGTSDEDIFNLTDLPSHTVIDGGDGLEFDTLVLDSSLYTGIGSVVIDSSLNTLALGTSTISSLGGSRFSLTDDNGNLYVLKNIEAIEVADKVFNIQPEVWQPVESVTRYDGTVWEDDVVIDLTQLLGEATQGSLTQDGTQIKLDNELLLSISQDTRSGEALQLIADANGTRILEFSGVEHVTFTTGDTDDPNLLITEFLGLI